MRVFLCKYELLILHDLLCSSGKERFLEFPGLFILIAMHIPIKISHRDDRREVVQKVLHSHTEDAIIYMERMHEPALALVNTHLFIRLSELVLDIVAPELII